MKANTNEVMPMTVSMCSNVNMANEMKIVTILLIMAINENDEEIQSNRKKKYQWNNQKMKI